MRASFRIDELDLIKGGPAVAALQEAIVACADYLVGVVDFAPGFVVSVNDPNPDKVHAVLEALADMGIVLG